MIGWLLWRWRRRGDWTQPCGCAFTHERDGSTTRYTCHRHWLLLH